MEFVNFVENYRRDKMNRKVLYILTPISCIGFVSGFVLGIYYHYIFYLVALTSGFVTLNVGIEIGNIISNKLK